VLTALIVATEWYVPRQQTHYFHFSSFADFPRFLFMPPSRYIFYGAEVMDSPLPSPSPSRNISGYLDSTSEGSDSDSVGEIDDNEAGGDQLDGIIQDLMRHERSADRSTENKLQTTTNNGQLVTRGSSGSDSTSDDGFDEGDADKASEIYNSEVTKQALSLILGGLSSYTCASEENSLLSAGSDDPVTPGSSEPCCLPSVAADTLLTDRPFSGVTMDRPPTQPDYPEPGNQDHIEDTKKGASECGQSGDDCVLLGTKDDVSSDASATLKSDSLHS